MKKIIHVQIEKGDTQYVATFVDFPIVTQAPTLDKLTENIKEAFALYQEDASDERLASTPAILANLELDYA